MGTSRVDVKRSLMGDDEEEEEEEDSTVLGFEDDSKKKRGKRGSSSSGGSTPPRCQVDHCPADMTEAKPYFRRHKVCEYHAKAAVVTLGGLQQRFCQQCSRFHEISEFDDTKRSCRRRLAGHNERRRKNASEYHGESSN
ncbi:hypothetical protein SLE2022_011760 [Rubroshorea leprosula]